MGRQERTVRHEKIVGALRRLVMAMYEGAPGPCGGGHYTGDFEEEIQDLGAAIAEDVEPLAPELELEGSCPICHLGAVEKLGDNFKCARCRSPFCGKCGGVKGPANENVSACSCEGRTL